jgi:hypothetical protein
MSLINDALKKAQRQRALDAAPLSGAPSGIAAAAVTTHVATATHRRSYAPLAFGLGILTLGVGATWVVMRYGFTDTAAPKPAAVPVASVAAPAPTAPAPAPAPASAPAPVVAVEALTTVAPAVTFPPPAPVAVTLPAATPAPAPVATTPAPAPAPVVVAQRPAQVVVPTVAPVVATPVVAVSAAASAEREARVYDFLNTLRITGVRGVDREARVLMNERVWRLNDVVSPALGLRLSGVKPGLLVFTDAAGKTYEKSH